MKTRMNSMINICNNKILFILSAGLRVFIIAIANFGLYRFRYVSGGEILHDVTALWYGEPYDDGSVKTFNMIVIQIDIDYI